MRLPVQTGTERTAVLPFQSTGTVVFNVNNTGTVSALLFRHSVSPLWITGVFTSVCTVYNTDAQLIIADNSFNWETIRLVGQINWAGVGGSSSFPSWLATTAFAANSAVPNIPVATDSLLEVDYFWALSGFACMQIQFPGGVTGNVAAELYQWVSPGEEVPSGSGGGYVATISVVGGITQAVFTIPCAQGWWRWGNIRSDGLSGGTSLSQAIVRIGWSTQGGGLYPNPTSGTCVGLWPFNPPPDFGTVSSYPWASTRCNSAAALFTNISQVLEKQGTVLGARLTAIDSPFNPQPATLATRTPIEKYFGAFETGVYTWSSPSPESQVYRPGYRTGYFSQTGNVVSFVPWVQLADTCYYNSIIFTDTSSTPYPMIAVTVDWHIEFRSTSPLFPPMVSATPLETVHQAHLAVGTMNPFTENPKHKGLKGAAQAIARDMARAVLGSSYRPVMYIAKRAINHLSQSVPGSKVPSNGSGGGGGRGKGKGKGKNGNNQKVMVVKAPAPAGKKASGGLAQYLAKHGMPKGAKDYAAIGRARMGH